MMKLPRRQFLQLAAGAAAVPAVSRIASAQAYPSRPITIIVPTGAGGPSDVIVRIVAERMRSSLGQPLIIENVPGANGTLGTGRVARAKPDGYTLGLQRLVLHPRGERSDLRAPLRRDQRFRARCADRGHPAAHSRKEEPCRRTT